MIQFYKYQGAGNDFIMVDDRSLQFPAANAELIHHLCTRRFGVGADGLILLQNAEGYDFGMVYFNADGRHGSMCGNGGRCIAAFARDLGIGNGEKLSFLAVDGPHEAILNENEIELRMQDVPEIIPHAVSFILNTGSPHYVIFQPDVMQFNILKLARAIRYSHEFEKEGINVNFVEETGFNSLIVRTYERGVEDETFSCGTGVVASAMAQFYRNSPSEARSHEAFITTKGGTLKVKFDYSPSGGFSNVWLIGPAFKVFEGTTG
jgi:diaminopimelate epimerase